mmetsp:Transcript_26636/g.44538  ORF Transcript_26636/g.44538 Transcript_26636/m.44538 type:complete len:1673 (+) Transcript_26636:146-5164(+)
MDDIIDDEIAGYDHAFRNAEIFEAVRTNLDNFSTECDTSAFSEAFSPIKPCSPLLTSDYLDLSFFSNNFPSNMFADPLRPNSTSREGIQDRLYPPLLTEAGIIAAVTAKRDSKSPVPLPRSPLVTLSKSSPSYTESEEPSTPSSLKDSMIIDSDVKSTGLAAAKAAALSAADAVGTVPISIAGLKASRKPNRPPADTESSERLRRPQNAFIMFSNFARKSLRDTHKTISNIELSKMLGIQWRSLDKASRLYFEQLAEGNRRDFNAAHPDFRYIGKRRRPKNKNDNNNEDDLSQSDSSSPNTPHVPKTLAPKPTATATTTTPTPTNTTLLSKDLDARRTSPQAAHHHETSDLKPYTLTVSFDNPSPIVFMNNKRRHSLGHSVVTRASSSSLPSALSQFDLTYFDSLPLTLTPPSPREPPKNSRYHTTTAHTDTNNTPTSHAPSFTSSTPHSNMEARHDLRHATLIHNMDARHHHNAPPTTPSPQHLTSSLGLHPSSTHLTDIGPYDPQRSTNIAHHNASPSASSDSPHLTSAYNTDIRHHHAISPGANAEHPASVHITDIEHLHDASPSSYSQHPTLMSASSSIILLPDNSIPSQTPAPAWEASMNMFRTYPGSGSTSCSFPAMYMPPIVHRRHTVSFPTSSSSSSSFENAMQSHMANGFLLSQSSMQVSFPSRNIVPPPPTSPAPTCSHATSPASKEPLHYRQSTTPPLPSPPHPLLENHDIISHQNQYMTVSSLSSHDNSFTAIDTGPPSKSSDTSASYIKAGSSLACSVSSSSLSAGTPRESRQTQQQSDTPSPLLQTVVPPTTISSLQPQSSKSNPCCEDAIAPPPSPSSSLDATSFIMTPTNPPPVPCFPPPQGQTSTPTESHHSTTTQNSTATVSLPSRPASSESHMSISPSHRHSVSTASQNKSIIPPSSPAHPRPYSLNGIPPFPFHPHLTSGCYSIPSPSPIQDRVISSECHTTSPSQPKSVPIVSHTTTPPSPSQHNPVHAQYHRTTPPSPSHLRPASSKAHSTTPPSPSLHRSVLRKSHSTTPPSPSQPSPASSESHSISPPSPSQPRSSGGGSYSSTSPSQFTASTRSSRPAPPQPRKVLSRESHSSTPPVPAFRTLMCDSSLRTLSETSSFSQPQTPSSSSDCRYDASSTTYPTSTPSSTPLATPHLEPWPRNTCISEAPLHPHMQYPSPATPIQSMLPVSASPQPFSRHSYYGISPTQHHHHHIHPYDKTSSTTSHITPPQNVTSSQTPYHLHPSASAHMVPQATTFRTSPPSVPSPHQSTPHLIQSPVHSSQSAPQLSYPSHSFGQTVSVSDRDTDQGSIQVPLYRASNIGAHSNRQGQGHGGHAPFTHSSLPSSSSLSSISSELNYWSHPIQTGSVLDPASVLPGACFPSSQGQSPSSTIAQRSHQPILLQKMPSSHSLIHHSPYDLSQSHTIVSSHTGYSSGAVTMSNVPTFFSNHSSSVPYSAAVSCYANPPGSDVMLSYTSPPTFPSSELSQPSSSTNAISPTTQRHIGPVSNVVMSYAPPSPSNRPREFYQPFGTTGGGPSSADVLMSCSPTFRQDSAESNTFVPMYGFPVLMSGAIPLAWPQHLPFSPPVPVPHHPSFYSSLERPGALRHTLPYDASPQYACEPSMVPSTKTYPNIYQMGAPHQIATTRRTNADGAWAAASFDSTRTNFERP